MLNPTNRTHRWTLYVVDPDGNRTCLGRYNAYEDAEWNYETRKEGIGQNEELLIEIEDASPGNGTAESSS